MLRMPEFDYIAPRSLGEAARIIGDLGSDAMAVAGGTDVYAKMKRGQFAPRHLVSLRSVPELRGIDPNHPDGLWIGAGETLHTITGNRTVSELAPALAHAAGSVAMAQIRNVATLGGNLLVDTRCNQYDQSFFWRQAAGFCLKKDGERCLVAPGSDRCLAVFSSDTAPVLQSLDAKVVLQNSRGSRTVAMSELYREDGIDFCVRRPDELMRGVIVPRESFRWRSTYIKLRRRDSVDFPMLGVAAALNLDRAGVCVGARVVLGAIASSPVTIDEARSLAGRRIDADLVERVAESAAQQSHPLDNADGSGWYRKRMTKICVKRALETLAGSEMTAGGR
jgi:4-hydroxybenzoyl-CoA reductase subunit beta